MSSKFTKYPILSEEVINQLMDHLPTKPSGKLSADQKKSLDSYLGFDDKPSLVGLPKVAFGLAVAGVVLYGLKRLLRTS